MNWKIALALSLPVTVLGATAIGSLMGGCTDNECTRADNQIETCAEQEQLTSPYNGMTDNQSCAPDTLRYCQSVCINRASCTAINASYCLDQVACPEIPTSSTLVEAGASDVQTFLNCMAGCADAGS